MAALGICRVFGKNPKHVHSGWIEQCFHGKKKYVAFYGIRYAAKPEGENRFKAPVPLTSEEAFRLKLSEPVPASSQEARDLLKQRSSLQNPPDFDVGSTDCLVLNVYTPKDPNLMNERLPVLVFIHGGGFKRGSSDPELLSPEAIVQFGVVFVTLNYRLGILGFLNLRSKEFPGNIGLKDQVQALKWIRDNIECFKGDPNNVTISGFSAGATCVNAHLISPMSKGLFHKAILHSGGVFFPWGYKGHHLEQKKAFESHEEFFSLIHDEEKTREMCRCAEDIFYGDCWLRHSLRKFNPDVGLVVEKEKEGAFLAEDIETAMMNVQLEVPVMAGITKRESLEYFIDIEVTTQEIHDGVNNDREFEQLLMDNLRWSKKAAMKNRDKIRNLYFPANPSVQDAVNGHLKLLEDIGIRRFYDGFKFGPDKSLHKDLYVYRFDHVSEMSLVEVHNRKPLSYQLPSEATHGDDVDYLYRRSYIQTAFEKSIHEDPRLRNREMLDVMERMCSLWASFCKTGKPESKYDSNFEWKPHSEETPCYLSIGKQLVLKEGSSLLDDQCRQFNDLASTVTPIHSEKASPEDE